MPNRSIRDERQRAVVDSGRPKVGEADPATRRAALQAALSQREGNVYGKGQRMAPAANPTADLSVQGAIGKIKDRKYRTLKATDEAG